MRWEKRGLVWGPDGSLPWARSHATVPTPVVLRDGEVRVYVGVLDDNGVGRVAYVDLDAEDPGRVLRASERPVLDIGERGTFDDNGVLPSVVVPDGDRLRMYYNGFQLGHHIRYTIFSGLAVSDDGGETFTRVSRAAVLDRSDAETTFRAAPYVMHENGSWRIWYPAGDSWVDIEGKEVPVVRMVHAESEDGIHWPEAGEPAVDFQDDDEHGIGRPWILRDGDLWRMFYSIRVRSRPGFSALGYAESPDGRTWTRKDEEMGIELSEGGFDAHMLRYGVPIELGGRTVMFYNGDNFGESGFGYAVLAE
jgi:hypothetical protein